MTKQHDIVIRGGTIVDGQGGTPYVGDVAVDGDLIVAVGQVEHKGRQEIDATGYLVTPGFVDVHTHYDGQVIWEQRLAPSSGHGVTTVVMGNCGVGFAPCRREDRARLVELMEGVEDIPGVVMTTGLSWDWESYPEYLDAVDSQPHDINIASYLPHAPLRVYAMGARATHREMATPDEIATMAKLAEEAVKAGAIGFSTSRTLFHRSSSGDFIPTLNAGEEELTMIARAVQSGGGGLLQYAEDYKDNTDVQGEFEMMKRVLRSSGCPLTLPTAQMHAAPELWREVLSRIEEARSEGLTVTGQVMPRGIGVLLGLELTMHPFCLCPTYNEIAHLPLSERVARMRDPTIRSRIVTEAPAEAWNKIIAAVRNFDGMYEGGDPIQYEPKAEESIGARAKQAGITPQEFAYDIMLKNDGHATIYMPFANYAHGNLDTVAAMMKDKNFVLGLGDGGAHFGSICDASYTTFVLTHWTRDRERGEKLTLPAAIKALSRDTAHMMGFTDRGVLAPGYHADINVIDYDGLKLHAPRVTYDLPSGGRRLTQKADGYVATLVNGEVVYWNGEPTKSLPGRLLRGAGFVPAARAAAAREAQRTVDA